MRGNDVSPLKYLLMIVISLAAVGVLLLIVFFGIKLFYHEDISYYENKCAEYAAQNLENEYVSIVFIGDGNVEYYPLEEVYYNDAVNRGIKNDTTLGVENRLQTSVFNLKPGAVVLMVGARDIETPRSINAIMKTYKDIVYSIFDETPTTDIYVMSVLPQNKDYEKANVDNNMKRIKELNSKLEAFCDTCAAVYLNLYDLLIDESGYLSKEYSDDGFHLNQKGYEVWTNLMKNGNQ